MQQTLCSTNESIVQQATLPNVPNPPLSELIVDGTRAWQLKAPQGTSIVGFEAFRTYTGVWFAEQTRWELRVNDALGGQGAVFESRQSNPDPNGDFTNPPTAHESFDIAGTVGHGVQTLTSIFGCLKPSGGENPCGSFRRYGVVLQSPVVKLEDPSPPTAPTLAGSLLKSPPVPGPRELEFSTSDSGAGVANARLDIDGVPAQFLEALNGGACRQPYTALVPCAASFQSRFTIDTTGLAPGTHTAAVTVTDGAGQVSSNEATFTVVAPPSSTGPPVLSGSPTVGGLLSATTGGWKGDPVEFHYAWLRCPAAVEFAVEASRCAPIAGTTDANRYAPVAADAGLRIMVRVTATNVGGATSVVSAPSELVTGGETGGDESSPMLSHVSFAPRRRLVRFACNEAAKLSLTILRRHGRKPLLSLTRPIAAGDGRLTLATPIRRQRVRPGTYVLVLSARDAAGNVSVPVRLPISLPRR